MSRRRLIRPVGFLQWITVLFILPVASAQQMPQPQPQRIPQKQAATISGRVFYADTMKEAAAVRVRLLQNMGIPVEETFTDSDGAFEFSNLRPVSFTVEVLAEGYRLASRSVDLSFLLGAEIRLTIHLEQDATVAVERPPGGPRHRCRSC